MHVRQPVPGVHSPLHLHSQLKQGSSLNFHACNELLQLVSTSCSASSHAPQSAAAPQRVLGTDGLISADKGAALKEARRKLSGLISLVLSMGGEGDKLELGGHQLHYREYGRETNSFKKLLCCCQMVSACLYFRDLMPSAEYLNTLWFSLSLLCCMKDVAKIFSDHLKGWPWMWLTFCMLLLNLV